MNTVILGPDDPAAPVLTMLHGWGAHLDLVRPLGEQMAALGYRVVMLDLPGFGQTPPPDFAWSVFDYAAAVAAHIRSLGIEKTHLFGHSFGGRLGLVLGAEHPERFIKMALADSAGVRGKPSISGQVRLKTFRFLQNTLRSIGMSKQADGLREWYTDKYGSADYKAAQGVVRETFVKVVNEDLLPYAARYAWSCWLYRCWNCPAVTVRPSTSASTSDGAAPTPTAVGSSRKLGM